jgi:hypothetical protein
LNTQIAAKYIQVLNRFLLINKISKGIKVEERNILEDVPMKLVRNLHVLTRTVRNSMVQRLFKSPHETET